MNHMTGWYQLECQGSIYANSCMNDRFNLIHHITKAVMCDHCSDVRSVHSLTPILKVNVVSKSEAICLGHVIWGGDGSKKYHTLISLWGPDL